MNLTHRQFEILVAAAESESFSAAAQRLGISQPSLSESIRRIEREIGARLFERTTRSLKLTDRRASRGGVARERCAISSARWSGSPRARAAGRAASRSRHCRRSPAPCCRRRSRRLRASIRRSISPCTTCSTSVRCSWSPRASSISRSPIKPAENDELVFEEIASDVAHLVCRADDPLARRKTVRWRDSAASPSSASPASRRCGG